MPSQKERTLLTRYAYSASFALLAASGPGAGIAPTVKKGEHRFICMCVKKGGNGVCECNPFDDAHCSRRFLSLELSTGQNACG